MKVMDIIKIACDFTGNENIAASLDEDEQVSSLTQEQQKTVKTLVKCLNLVQNEIATQYIPLQQVQQVSTKDFKVLYSQFENTPISIVWAKDRFGRNIRFKTFSDYLIIFAPNASVKYQYLPQNITEVDGEMSQPLVPARIYAYGVAREYFLQQALSDDADIWEVRFKDSLQVFARKKQEVKMPCRRWL